MALLGFEALGKLALGQLPEGPLPFNQIDWSVPARIIPRTAPDQTHLNIELFTNPIPFAQYDWSKPCKPPAAKEQPNWSLNLELYKNPIPFGPYDYNKSRWTPTLKEQPNWALNLQLYKNLIPFGPYDYNRVKKSLPVIPDQQLRNIALLSVVTANPFFTQDFSSGHLTPDWLPPLQYPNLVLSNPIPFGPYDYSEGPFVPKLAKPDQQALNTKLYTNPVPFGPYDYQKAIFPVFYRPDPTQQLNLPRSVGSPFIPIDYQKSIFPIFYRPDASQQLNLSQNVGAPLIPVDWSKPFNIPELVFIQYPNLILLQPTTANPFYLQDFSKPFVPTSTKYDQQSLNLQLYTNAIPFAQFDWPRPTSYVRLVPEQNNLPNIVLPIVFPFYTRDWSNTKFLPSVPSPYMALNINSFTNPVPFNQYDWTKLYNIKPIISDLDNLPNLVLQPIVIANPFYTQDFSKTQFLPSVPSPYMGTNQNLYTNTIPFNQYDWTKLWSVKPIASDQDTLPNIVLLNPIMPSTPLGIFSWQDWNVNSKVYLSKFPELPNLVIILTPPVPPEEQHLGGRRWKEDYERLVRDLHRQSDDIKQAAATLSSMGGHARAKSLTAKQRSNIASKAASIRWK